jgi:hypothetical protein
MNENSITTINYEYKDGGWKIWITFEPVGGQNKAGQ